MIRQAGLRTRSNVASPRQGDVAMPFLLALAAAATGWWQLSLDRHPFSDFRSPDDGSPSITADAPAPSIDLQLITASPRDRSAPVDTLGDRQLPPLSSSINAMAAGDLASGPYTSASPHAPTAIRLDQNPLGWRRRASTFTASTLTAPSTAKATLDGIGEDLAPDWRSPVARDLALFVATDDEALSWSFSEASPNFGRLVYQEDRVDFGKFSAGVAVQQADASLALAYLEEDGPSRFGVDTSERYVGVLVTYLR